MNIKVSLVAIVFVLSSVAYYFFSKSTNNTAIVSQNAVVVDSTLLPQTVNAVIDSNLQKTAIKDDLKGYNEDTVFVNNGLKYRIMSRRSKDSEDRYCVPIVQRLQNNRWEAVFSFESNWGYSVVDQDGDGNLDITVAGQSSNPCSENEYYMFNPIDNKFIDEKQLSYGWPWEKISKGLFYDYESFGGNTTSSRLFTLKNGHTHLLGYIVVSYYRFHWEEVKTGDNNAEELAFPRAFLYKTKKENKEKNEWEEEISPEVVKKYFPQTDSPKSYYRFLKEVWQQHYKRLQ
jgi:hypothetical protein